MIVKLQPRPWDGHRPDIVSAPNSPTERRTAAKVAPPRAAQATHQDPVTFRRHTWNSMARGIAATP
jgi:hypothetical protein